MSFRIGKGHPGNYPNICIIQQDFYIVDILTRPNTIQEGQRISSEIFKVLRRGFFYLRKWCSNSLETLKAIELSHLAHDILELNPCTILSTIILV